MYGTRETRKDRDLTIILNFSQPVLVSLEEKICNIPYTTDERVHRLAMATFLRTFSHDGILVQLGEGWGVHALPLSLYLPPRIKLGRPLSGKTSKRKLPVLSHVAPLPFLSDIYHKNKINYRYSKLLPGCKKDPNLIQALASRDSHYYFCSLN